MSRVSAELPNNNLGGDHGRITTDRRTFLKGVGAKTLATKALLSVGTVGGVGGGTAWYLGRGLEQAQADIEVDAINEQAVIPDTQPDIAQGEMEVAEANSIVEFVRSPNLYAGRLTDPELLWEIYDANPDAVTDVFRMKTSDIGLGDYASSQDSNQEVAERFADNTAVQIERMFNAGMDERGVTLYPTMNETVYANDINHKFTRRSAVGLWGLDGSKQPGFDMSQNLDDPLTDDEIIAMPPVKSAMNARTALLKDFFRTAQDGQISSYRVRRLDVVRSMNFTKENGGGVEITLGVTKVTGGVDGEVEVVGDEIVGTTMYSIDPCDDGIVRSLISPEFQSEDSYDIFDQVAAAYK